MKFEVEFIIIFSLLSIKMMILSPVVSNSKIIKKNIISNLRKNNLFSVMRFKDVSNKKELTDGEKLDRIDIELKFGKNTNNDITKDKEMIRRDAKFY